MRESMHRWLAALIIAVQLLALVLPGAMPVSAQSATVVDPIYLPLVGVAPGPPQFTIISPADGLSISGTSIFAVQPIDPGTVRRVAFRAGSIDLGVDSTAADGFQVYLDASLLPAGPLALRAIATGPTGETTTQTVNVTVVPQPPASAAVDARGATLGTASGNTIVVPPGAVNQATNIAVADKTQQQVTADAGIDWDGLGVTFLGAIDVQTSGPISRPLGVSSVGFGNRVQPGQAVVTYRILPDADGDGVGELVVVNGANLAPNGTIISSPVNGIVVTAMATRNRNGLVRQAAAGLSGPPGTVITIDGNGFNPLSTQGNRVRFRSQVNGQMVELPAAVDPNAGGAATQQLMTLIPLLPPGPATFELINQSTGATAGPFDLTVEAAPPLGRPAATIIDEALQRTNTALTQLKGVTDESFGFGDLTQAISVTTQMRAYFQQISANPTPDQAELLANVATLMENANLASLLSRTINPQTRTIHACDLGALKDIATGLALAGATLLALASAPASVPLLILYGGGFLGGVGSGVFVGAGVIECLTPPPPPCGAAPAASGGGTTGMGAAPPPGGSGCGNANGGGGFVQSAGLAQLENGRYVVRIFPTGGGAALTPFTGASDPGGYFFIPLIPANEPFRAVATDRLTGASVTHDGIGPALNQSVYMNFDFTGAQGNLFAIQIGDTITDGVPGPGAGNIEIPGGVDIYTFSGAAGQQVFFDLFGVDPALTFVHWKLVAPGGAVLFDQIFNCCGGSDAGVQTLPESGVYTLRVGESGDSGTGTYGFTLWNVPPPQRFTIAIGDTITNGVPGPGAGNIESPGVKDIYTFNAAAGQQVFFDLFGVASTAVYINWKLTAPDGAVVFDRIFNCCGGVDAGVQTLALSGVYTLTVGDDSDADIGVYGFKLWNVPPPDQFAIAIGDTVSDGVPGPGAGNIESPGVKDIYTFNVTAGQRVYFALSGVPVTLVQVQWKLTAPDGEVIFDRILNCCGGQDAGEFTLAQTGVYTLTFGDDNDAGTGTYSFELRVP
jgi:hypothetical protein